MLVSQQQDIKLLGKISLVISYQKLDLDGLM
jgi:hypothetical protein